MALNFSHGQISPAHLPDDNLVSPVRKNGDCFRNQWHSNREFQDHFDYGRERCEVGSSQGAFSGDILDLLPSDPFGMDISTTFTALTGWLEDLEVDYNGYGRDGVGTSDESYHLFEELNFIWNEAMRFQALPGSNDHKFNASIGYSGSEKKQDIDGSCHGGLESVCHMKNIMNFVNGKGKFVSEKSEEPRDCYGICCEEKEGTPHDALVFALCHLGVRDLLAVERVCKSLHSTVRGDQLLWRSIHIDQPLNEKITDDVLLEITNRAKGNLQCLSLVECPRITDDGLKRVLKNNPSLSKLSLPGCTRLSIEGIVHSLRDFKFMDANGVKQLRIGGLYGVTQKHFEELKFLLGSGTQMQQNARKPHFYRRGNFYLPCDDDRDIDIQMCPRCQNLRLVYDCPVQACREKDHATQVCRACTLCIPRCAQCGRCINDIEYEETFFLELQCSDCSAAEVSRVAE